MSGEAAELPESLLSESTLYLQLVSKSYIFFALF